MDSDLKSIQEARELVEASRSAMLRFQFFTQDKVDQIVAEMAAAGEAAAGELGRQAHEETGFGRPESKKAKNVFATKTLLQRMRGMRTAGIINKIEDGSIWEIAVPMGVVAALIPSTNPTSTAMYKAIIAAKARCGIVMSPHPRAVKCTLSALRTVADAAYAAGAPQGLFGCMTEVSLAGTNALLEHPHSDVILATGGSAMVRAAYSKGKPAYGVGSGNVPVYVDRSADVSKAAADLVFGASFDWGTLCSTERSIVADVPVKSRLIEELKAQKAHVLNEREKDQLRAILLVKGRLNVDQVGKSPQHIAKMAGFAVPGDTRALVAEVQSVGKAEPLSMETLSPILSLYVADGWEAGCERCIEILSFGGIGHTLGLHCTNDRVIEAFALEKPAMRIVVNTVAALGSVGFTNRLFPSMTLGPGTIGGSITSDNISPMHLVNIKRLAFETDPINPSTRPADTLGSRRTGSAGKVGQKSWMTEIEGRLRERAGNPSFAARGTREISASESSNGKSSADQLLDEERITALIRRFRK